MNSWRSVCNKHIGSRRNFVLYWRIKAILNIRDSQVLECPWSMSRYIRSWFFENLVTQMRGPLGKALRFDSIPRYCRAITWLFYIIPDSQTSESGVLCLTNRDGRRLSSQIRGHPRSWEVFSKATNGAVTVVVNALLLLALDEEKHVSRLLVLKSWNSSDSLSRERQSSS